MARRKLPVPPPGSIIPWNWPGTWRTLPKGARAWCQRCQVVSIKRGRGRRFCGGCSKNDHTRRRWLKAGCRETY
jgi:hypothetical protein